MTKHLLTAAATLLLAVLPFSAASAEDIECHLGEAFGVAVKPHDDEPGAMMAVTAVAGGPAPRACAFDPATADVVLGGPGEPLWFAELAGAHLVATRSTGPQGDLVVYDLATGATILDVPADDFAVEGAELSYWERIGDGTAENCAEYAEYAANDLGAVIVERRVLDLAAAIVTNTGEVRCDATQ